MDGDAAKPTSGEVMIDEEKQTLLIELNFLLEAARKRSSRAPDKEWREEWDRFAERLQQLRDRITIQPR
jgi:hypothetical protein